MNLKAFNTLLKEKGCDDNTEIGYMDMNFGGLEQKLDQYDISFIPKTNTLLIESKHFEYLD